MKVMVISFFLVGVGGFSTSAYSADWSCSGQCIPSVSSTTIDPDTKHVIGTGASAAEAMTEAQARCSEFAATEKRSEGRLVSGLKRYVARSGGYMEWSFANVANSCVKE